MDPLQQGIQLVGQAVQLDSANKVAEAIQLYRSSVQCFSQALQVERDPNRAAQIQSKMQEYHNRMLVLMEAMNQPTQTQAMQTPTQTQPTQMQPAQAQQQQQQQQQAMMMQQMIQQQQQQTVGQSDPYASLMQANASGGAVSGATFNPTTTQYASSTNVWNPAGANGANAASAVAPPTQFAHTMQGTMPQSANTMQQPAFHQPQPSLGSMSPSQGTMAYGASFGMAGAGPGAPVASTGTSVSSIPPLVLQLAAEHPRDVPNLKVAIQLAEAAKEADHARAYQQALDLYTESLERLVIVWGQESNPQIKQSLHTTIDSYMNRAERIKESCNIKPNRLADIAGSQTQVQPQSQPLNAERQGSQPNALAVAQPAPPQVASSQEPPKATNLMPSVNGTLADEPPIQGEPGKGRPIQIANETKSVLGRQRLKLSVSLESNAVEMGSKLRIFVKVENRSTMTVNHLKVTLRRIERMQKIDQRGRHTMETTALKVHRQEFFQGQIFPLPAESNYSGELAYKLPKGLKATNMTQPEIFQREYDLTVQCNLSMRKNLDVRFPLILL